MATRLNARFSGEVVEVSDTAYVNCYFAGCRFVGILENSYFDRCMFEYCQTDSILGQMRNCVEKDDYTL